MFITISEALQLTSLQQAEVVAGWSRLDNKIAWVHCSDLPDVGQWLRGGELVISTGLTILSKDTARSLVQSVSEAGGAGLLIARDPCLTPEVIDELIASAIRYSLPLLLIPKEVRFVDITEEISKAIIQREYEESKRSKYIYRRFVEAMLGGKGLSAILRMLGLALKCPVLALDKEFNLLAEYSENIPVDRIWADVLRQQRFSTDLLASLDEAGLLSKIRKSRSIAEIGRYPSAEDIAHTAKPILLKGEVYGFLLLGQSYDKLSNQDLVLVEEAANVITIELIKEREIHEIDSRLSNQLFDDVLSGSYVSAESIKRRASFLGYDFSQPYQILTIQIDEIEKLRTDHRDKGEAFVSHIKRRFFDAVKETLATARAAVMLTHRDDYIVIFYSLSQGDSGSAHTLAEQIRQNATPTLGNTGVSIGLSNRHTGVAEIQTAYREAEQTLQVGRMVWDTSTIIEYEQLGIYQLFLHRDGREEIDRYWDRYIAKIEEVDRKHNSDLIRTLEELFRRNGNRSRTARALYIHRNTLDQRLAKIEKICGLDLENADDRLKLQLGLWLKPLRTLR
ncbi:MAG: PucR family transcriptional regulator ligand-binding domain-containing protein [Chloroflexi bacterium]|nr:PucR family transcriptional regulator ligand-binding domain-containing protein [Chloroflexota bacterium]MCL5075681.1 PucR family transcriptional regulator ligand-binding domain-containing protein [Chloroflexota bacterium]